jgi:hypothetical protein
VQLEWETRIGPGRDRNWRTEYVKREERDEQTSPQKSTERDGSFLLPGRSQLASLAYLD